MYKQTPWDKLYIKHVISLVVLEVLYFQMKVKAAQITDHFKSVFQQAATPSSPSALILSPNQTVATDTEAFKMSNGWQS